MLCHGHRHGPAISPLTYVYLSNESIAQTVIAWGPVKRVKVGRTQSVGGPPMRFG